MERWSALFQQSTGILHLIITGIMYSLKDSHSLKIILVILNASFGMTEHYFVFVEIPYYVNLTKLFLNNIIGKPVLDAMKVYPNEQVQYYVNAWQVVLNVICYYLKAQFHVVRRENGEILETRYLTGGFTFFHVINVYEDEGKNWKNVGVHVLINK